MDIQFDRTTEAIAAITWVICTADKVGSAEERNFIFEQTRRMAAFQGMSYTEFSNLLGATRSKLFNTLPNNGDCLARPGVEAVIQSVGTILDAPQKAQVFDMAVNLAHSDRLHANETEILELMKIEFGLDRGDASQA